MRRGRTLHLVALLAVSVWLVIGAAPVGAVHEITVGQTYYSDGTTAKTAARGTTLTIYATGIRPLGVYGGVTDPNPWWVTVGQRDTVNDIPCYIPPPSRPQPAFVDGVDHYKVGRVIPNSDFVVPSWLPSGTWEVCFYSQPTYDEVTAPVYLTVP